MSISSVLHSGSMVVYARTKRTRTVGHSQTSRTGLRGPALGRQCQNGIMLATMRGVRKAVWEAEQFSNLWSQPWYRKRRLWIRCFRNLDEGLESKIPMSEAASAFSTNLTSLVFVVLAVRRLLAVQSTMKLLEYHSLSRCPYNPPHQYHPSAIFTEWSNIEGGRDLFDQEQQFESYKDTATRVTLQSFGANTSALETGARVSDV